MTDEQIIIDGVDVSGCVFYKDNGECSAITIWADYCKAMPDCIYKLKKQLEAKEQECEELKKGYAELTDIVAPYMDDFTGYNEELGGFDIVLCVKQLMEQLDQLKAENEELKRQHQGDKGLITSTGKQNYQLLQEYDKLKAENEELKGIRDRNFLSALEERKRADKYFKTLTEIKEIIEQGVKIHDDIIISKQILQKINEVE